MKVFKGIVYAITAVALAITFVAAGLAACLLPPVTHGLSSMFARDDLSPYDRAQLVEVADATRDFSFGSHDEAALYRTIYQVCKQYSQKITDAGGTLPADFPKLDIATSLTSASELKLAFAGASEWYCYSAQTVSHLDDCYQLAAKAFPLVIIAAAVSLVGLVFAGVTGRKRAVGSIVFSAGILVIVSFVAFAVWSIVDFNGMFRALHQLFFSQGNWEFPYDSLLICALPTEFWMGMGAVWLVAAVVLSILSIVIGRKLRR